MTLTAELDQKGPMSTGMPNIEVKEHLVQML